MAFSRNALRFGAWTGLFTSGAALGVLVEKNGGPGQVMKSWKKTNIHKSLTPADCTPAETKEGTLTDRFLGTLIHWQYKALIFHNKTVQLSA
jgi:hypothetical protein